MTALALGVGQKNSSIWTNNLNNRQNTYSGQNQLKSSIFDYAESLARIAELEETKRTREEKNKVKENNSKTTPFGKMTNYKGYHQITAPNTEHSVSFLSLTR